VRGNTNSESNVRRWRCTPAETSRLPALLLGVICCLIRCAAPVGAADFAVPAGFEVSLFADDALAHDIFSMTIDARGRVVVAGPGYVKILHDENGDGVAERAQLFSNRPASGAHGMLFLGNDLICTGDNTVMRLRDTDGDGAADGEPEVWTSLRNPEHGANGVVQGPDGWIYLICGNDAGVSEKQVTSDSSPVKEPRCGAVVRFSPDGRRQEVYAHGFRNPYDLDFNPLGQLFTVDADGERDYHLPWYAPTRLFDIAAGMEHGWLINGWQRSWNRPQSFFDNVERLAEIGRGSPTGLVCYRHRQFPEHYRGGIFSACWTLGRVYYFPLELSGSTYKTRVETFLETTGENGFSPCDLAVGPNGDLFVAIGGRRTRGSVFRVRYVGAGAAPVANLSAAAAAELQQVLSADQPLAAWSRARWEPLADRLGRAAFEQAATNRKLTPAARIRAVEVLVERFGGLGAELAKTVISEKTPELSARVAWALGREPTNPAYFALAAELTASENPAVQRAAWETIAELPALPTAVAEKPAWLAAFNSADRRVRAAAIHAAEHDFYPYKQYLRARPAGKVEISFAEDLARHRVGVDSQSPVLDDTYVNCVVNNAVPELRLEAIRLLELLLGDMRLDSSQAEVFSGYRATQADKLPLEVRKSIADRLAPIFPTQDAEVNRELARLLGMLAAAAPDLLQAISRQWTDASTAEDDIHYLIVSALLPGPRSQQVTQRTAKSLLRLETKLRDRGEHPSQNWPFRVAEAFEELLRLDPALADHLIASADFGRPQHALYAAHLKGDPRLAAIRRLLKAAEESNEPPGSELIALVAELPPDEGLPFARRLWDEPALRDAVALALARYALVEDREQLISALASLQPSVVEQSAGALGRLDSSATPVEIRQALIALRQACQVPQQAALRATLVTLLDRWTRSAVQVDDKTARDPAILWSAWSEWFAKAHPDQAKALALSGAIDQAEWQKRLAGVAWDHGDAQRGRALFERKACHRCHQSSGQLGPDLTGAVSRLSREDLFAAIVDPNKEVSPAFQTTRVVTTAGRVYYGLLVYESPEATLLQTDPDTTVRIVGAEKSDMQPARQSLMPSGLLNADSDADLADLNAYLKTLGKK
jgi:putative membrane-bound dehydrogenase-like protein